MSQKPSLEPAPARTSYSRAAQEETLIADARAGLTPSQLVERKLMGVLRGGALPVSHLLNAVKGRRPV
jgi:hypothetical protein